VSILQCVFANYLENGCCRDDTAANSCCVNALLGVVAAAAGVVAVVAADESEKKRKRRQMWVRPMLQCKQQEGAFNMLMADLHSDDIEMYEGFTRMSPEHFDELLELVRHYITKSCPCRMPVSAEIRLAVTLRFLATGE